MWATKKTSTIDTKTNRQLETAEYSQSQNRNKQKVPAKSAQEVIETTVHQGQVRSHSQIPVVDLTGCPGALRLPGAAV